MSCLTEPDMPPGSVAESAAGAVGDAAPSVGVSSLATTLHATTAAKIGFASLQNDVPLIVDLTVENAGAESLDDLTLRLTADPEFLEPRTWCLDRLAAGTSTHVADRDVRCRAATLAELTEAIRGTVAFTLQQGDETLARVERPVELLGRSEWGGASSMAELLAAFVMPNDPAVDRILKSASEVLRRSGKKDGIDGYEGKSRTRVWELASAIWSAVCALRISYALPPASFETQGQKVRTPGAILEGRVATCLDTALLFAAALEQAGLNPLVVSTKGHAFAGVWLQPQEFSSLVTDEAAPVRKRVDLKELVAFETTLATGAHPPGFAAAVEAARRQLAEELDGDFVMALDVRRARMRRIRPLGSAPVGMAPAADVDGQVAVALEEAPVLPGFDVEAAVEAATAADRIALWQRKLLDLTTRNRLLNLPDGAKAVRLVCPDPARLEDRLAAGKRIKVVAMPDLAEGGRDEALHRQRTGDGLREEYGRAALERGEVLSALDPKKLDASLVDLYRKAKSDLDEGGANTLYLALGFLKWRKSETDPRSYRAPLILMPVRLERKSALSGVSMLRHDDEPRFNLTLLQLLRQDFELTMPSLEGALPTDESGIDVAGIWNIVRRAVRDVPGFEVVEEVVLGTFSFAKYLMWKDLADRTEQLKANAVVRHLIERAEKSFPCGPDFPKPERLDDEVDPANLFVPLPADSSQLAAVVASARGCDFVLDGPPGTGKSQTIANMIAHNLALGRRVLFVAEKMAALDVVHRRLAEKGLGEFCLELHSSKTSKVEILKSLERAWDARDALTAEEWANEAAQVKRLRDRVNDVVRLLHRRHPNGLTLHGAMGRVVRDWTPDMPDLGWPDGLSHDSAALDGMREVVRRLDLNRRAVRDLPAELEAVSRREWSNSWQERVVATAREVGPALTSLIAARDALLATTRLPLGAEDRDGLDRLRRLATSLLLVAGLDVRFAFAPDAPDRIALARKVADAVEEYWREEASLSVPFSREALSRLDLDRFDSEWERANGRFWPFSILARRGVAKRLGEAGGASSRPEPGRDLPVLRRLSSLIAVVSGATILSGKPGSGGLDGDPTLLRRLSDAAEEVRAALSAAADGPEALVDLRRAVSTLALDANELLAADGRVAASVAELSRRLAGWSDVVARIDEALAVEGTGARSLSDTAALADAVIRSASSLKAWCDWQRVRREAVDAGLLPVVRAVEAGAVPKGGSQDLFETIYSRWFAARGIDAEPRLRDLVTVEHADDIEAYRRLDDRLSKLSVRYIRAKVCGAIPDKADVGRKDGYGVLKHELRKQRAHKPVRQLATEMGEAFTRLAPCMLMSPLSIAQYLPADQAMFDLVIFDEASQIAPWDAVGSIARGRQVVVAGDPRQMPPTNFFNRAAAASDEDVEEDMESILDECLGAGVPSHGLTWHYRSRHESLIAFSNHRFYDGSLITFPAAVTRDSAVEWRRVDGVYAKGKERTNGAEAQAIVAEVVRRLTDPVRVAAGHTVAVVTLNSEQQALVENLLDVERKKRPEIERFFGEDAVEPVVVKNLETVQGDERDVVLIGIGYGPTEPGAGTMSMNFGPLNRDGGWRRLNVAITRARREMVVFTSFDPGFIDLNRTGARAVKDLKHFLEFADRGTRALGEAVQGSLGGHESPFEEAVASMLSEAGWIVVPQIGVSRFRIDLGVVHPDRPGDYLAGVECDGAAYHSAATARDRDKVRQAILEGLGWNLVRVWSTDWWVDKRSACRRLDTALRALLDRSREAKHAAVSETPPDASAGEVVTPANDDAAGAVVQTVEPAVRIARAVAAEVSSAGTSGRSYEVADLSQFVPRPDLFHEPSYDETLRQMVAHVLLVEAPVSIDGLVNRIARAHDFQRSGRVIRERVVGFAERGHHVREDAEGKPFAWLAEGDDRNWRAFRVPTGPGESRGIDEIAFEELRAAGDDYDGTDPAAEVGRLFGVKRLSVGARRRIELALSTAGRPPEA